MSLYSTVLFVGPPGVGKSFIGKRLAARKSQLFYFSSGDMLREQGVDQTREGELLSDDYVVREMQGALERSVETGKFHPDAQTLILDGIPRTIPQVGMIEKFARVHGIIHFEATDTEKLVRQMLRRIVRRDDDMEPIIRRRLEIYGTQTKPMLDQYDGRIIVNVDGDRDLNTVRLEVEGIMRVLYG